MTNPHLDRTDPAIWRICAVIVLFHPDEGVGHRVTRIAQQVDGLVIVDNGPAPRKRDWLDLRSGSGVHLIQNPRNLGVATALNQGMEFARDEGYTHALLLDQDTEPLDHMVSSMRRCVQARSDIDQVAVIGANLLDASTGNLWFQFPEGATQPTEVRTVITSGSLVSLQIAGRLGAFREDFFIDHVDDEYCLRARAHGYKVLFIPEPLAIHALGLPKIRRLPWRTIGTTNHSAIRRYYMTRNHIVLARQYLRQEPGWVLQTLYTRLKSFLLMLLFDDDRTTKLRLMWRGLVDGLAGRTGELPGSAGRPDR